MNANRPFATPYIGPPIGLVYQSSATLLVFLLSFLAVFGFVFRGMFGFFKKKTPWIIIGIVVMGIALFVGVSRKGESGMRIVVLGMDGLSPDVVEALMAKGKLPHFAALREQGTYARLATTVPPQSPVAWASFATGTNPGKHGIFDFLIRDPRTYLPDLSLSRPQQPRVFTLGGIKVPLGSTKLRSPIQGEPFWRVTSRCGIPTVILRHPLTFPPEKVNGVMLSGLGTPDVLGTQGTFTFYTTKAERNPEAGGRTVEVTIENGAINTVIPGPRATPVSGGKDAALPLQIEVLRQENGIRLVLNGKPYALKAGSWSPWIRTEFSVNWHTKVRGIVRFYLKSIDPAFELYMSPVNFDPEAPAFPVSYPASFSKRLAKDTGLYHTLGQAGDTWMLNEGKVSEAAALEQYYQVLDEDEKLLMHELQRFETGIFFFYFGVTDTVQHMFSRRQKSSSANAKNDPVEDIYIQMDRVLGNVMEKCGRDTALIVLSDHGFAPYTRTVHVNTWLKENGYLALKEGSDASGEFFEQVDWGRTKAYALGLSGVYLNLRDREGEGIVAPGEEAEQLKRDISARLRRAVDDQSGAAIVNNVYFKEDVYTGGFAHDAPDIIVGLKPGWRFSWQTALGGIPDKIFENNVKHWNGDHIFDAASVPGVLFMNRRINTSSPAIIDIAPTILSLSGCEIPDAMDGKDLVRDMHE